MAVPTDITDLSTTASSNSPAGTDPIGTSLDDFLRGIQAIIKQNVSKGLNIASASSITIPNEGNYFEVTGTTTINSIADSWNGRHIVLKFQGVATLTHSASLVLYGENITTAAGDILTFINDTTGVWRLTSDHGMVSTIEGYATAASSAQTAAETAQGLAETAQGLAETAQTAAEAAQTAAEAVYDSFDDRYLGAKASAPTLDNDGNALSEGALYWNTLTNAMYVYDGSAWVTVANYSQINTTEVTATEGQTAFTTHSYTAALSSVYLNGSRLADADYTFTNATTVTLTTGATAGDLFELVSFEAIATPDNAPMLPARNGVLNQEPVTQGTSTRTGFSATKYTGNGSTQSISTGVDMATGDFGGLIWIKQRDGSAISHRLFDTIRGEGEQLYSDLTNAESFSAISLTSFDASGFTVGSSIVVNDGTPRNYIAWSWQTNQKVEPTYGSELVPNNTFDTDTSGWTLDSGDSASVTSGEVTLTRNDADVWVLDQSITNVVGETYQVVVVCRDGTRQTQVQVGTTQGGSDTFAKILANAGSNKTFTMSYIAESTAQYINIGVSGGTGTAIVDSISVKQITNSAKTNRGKPYTCHYNSDLGFSIVGYEGDGVNGHEIPHHLGRVPELSIQKNRTGTGYSWLVTSSLFPDEYLEFDTGALNASSYSTTRDANTFNALSYNSTNAPGIDYISYHFTSIPNVSKVGKYIGTGAAGNYVECGFKPAWVMAKNLSSGTVDCHWTVIDSSRGDGFLHPNLSNAEGTSDLLDFVDNGFVWKDTSITTNTLNDEYLFLAFAESSTDATKAWTDYEYATSQDTLSIKQNTLLSFANGFSASGQVDTQENVGAGVTYEIRGPELVTNGTFDSNTTSWSTYDDATLSYDTGRAKSTAVTSKVGVYQAITGLTIGAEYQISFDAEYHVGSNVSLYLYVDGSLSANPAGLIGTITDTINQTWIHNFVATATNHNIGLVSSTGVISAGEYAFFDNISIKQVKNPNAHLWLYKDKGGSYGVTEYRPLEGTSRNQADKWGVQSPLDASLRTTAKHFDYESETGVALASSETSSFEAWKAFYKNDYIDGSSPKWLTANGTTTGWLQYKFNEKRVLKSWRFKTGNVATLDPKRFTIEGSNDGLNWTAIDSTYTSSDYVGNGIGLWGNLQDTSANSVAYYYHRINITANNGNATYVGFEELEFNTILPSDYYLINEGVMYEHLDNIAVNGEFTTDTDWTKGTGWTISGGTASSDGTQVTNSYIYSNTNIFSKGETYLVSFEVTARSAGSVALVSSGAGINYRTATGTYTEIITPASNDVVNLVASSDFVGSIDNVIVRPITGQANHATPIERIYLAELMTNDDGEVSSYTNLPVAKQKITEAEVQGDLKVHGEIENRGMCTAWVTFDGSVNPPLIRNSYNVKDVVDAGTGLYKVIFEEQMDHTGYVVNAQSNTWHTYASPMGIYRTKAFATVGTGDATHTAVDSLTVDVQIFGGKDVR